MIVTLADARNPAAQYTWLLPNATLEPRTHPAVSGVIGQPSRTIPVRCRAVCQAEGRPWQSLPWNA